MKIFIVAGKRTPFGVRASAQSRHPTPLSLCRLTVGLDSCKSQAFGGALKGLTATDLTVHATKAALAAGGVSPSIVDTVVVGNVQQTSADAAYLAR